MSAGQTAPAAVPLTPLTYEAALDLATSRNLGLEAARRQRAIREAAIRAARQIPNPDVTFDVTRDLPHEAWSVGMPIELRIVRKELRQTFYSLIAADERVRLDESVVEISRRVRDAAQARFETGAAPRLEVLQSDLGVARAEADLELARATRVAAQ